MSVEIGQIDQLLPKFLEKKSYSKTVILVDANTKKHCLQHILNILPKTKIISINAGEKHKTLETCSHIWQAMTAEGLDRHALLINVGGGVIGDMGGFCASTYKRGIDFIQIPTTLLSQVDASVGGKLGIDFQGLKNHLGVFTLPKAVLIDPKFLKTLPWRELRSGFAEIIKHCLIKDKSMFDIIKKLDLEDQNLKELIAHSVKIKSEIVEADFTEKTIRKTLNFGHTIGHAVETHLLDHKTKHALHGEAIAAGMIMEAYLAYKKGMLAEADLIDIEEYLFSVYGQIEIQETDFNEILKHCKQDKKNKNNIIRASLLNGVGTCAYDIPLSLSDIKLALKYYTQK
jgi:3-dehydroquinate synthase